MTGGVVIVPQRNYFVGGVRGRNPRHECPPNYLELSSENGRLKSILAQGWMALWSVSELT